jgi:hypothetical protein
MTNKENNERCEIMNYDVYLKNLLNGSIRHNKYEILDYIDQAKQDGDIKTVRGLKKQLALTKRKKKSNT